MPSYVIKTVRYFIFLFFLSLPHSLISACADQNIESGKKHSQEIDLRNNLDSVNENSRDYLWEVDNSLGSDKNNATLAKNDLILIGKNIKIASDIISSSSSELIEKTEYYALNKLSNAISSETEKWLSQYGMVRINFGLDREWTLKNNSIDILLPFYDNKVDWMIFSQLGYRNKDSRNTVNLGLGGRYFDNNWMYGLNTFYDYDVTGRNQRIGLGGEVWGDYTKFSINTYHRLSDWQESLNFENYHERPATGYDINSEFFLPDYPSFGIKLAYEQYFGKNITLFNRDTKQKNPRQTKLELTYTPIPLITIGANYRQGEKGHTETQFMTNLNYKFGIPLSSQLKSDNVAFMRTLVGSRHDLVERNNNIILDHQEREKDELFAIEPIIGYGQQEITINAPIKSYANIKHIRWVVPDKEFNDNHGKLSSNSGQSIVITLPSYQETHKSDYELNILVTDKQDRTKTVKVPIKILPFLINEKVNITGNEKNGYAFSDPIITYQGLPVGEFVKNARINKVTWTTEPPLGDESGLSFKWNDKPAQTDKNGKLTNKEGYLMPNVLISEKTHEKVVVYIQLDGAPRQEIGTVRFSSVQYHVAKVDVDDKKELIADGKQTYTYTAYIEDENNNVASEGQNISNIRWRLDDKNKNNKKLSLKHESNITGKGGKLIATLTSTESVNNVVVSLSVEKQEKPMSAKAVSFAEDPSAFHIKEEFLTVSPPEPFLTVGDGKIYTFRGTVVDRQNNLVKAQEIKKAVWKATDDEGKELTLTSQTTKTNDSGELIATLDSSKPFNKVTVSLSIENKQAVTTKTPVSVISEFKIDSVEVVNFEQGKSLPGDGHTTYIYKAKVVNEKGDKRGNQVFSGIQWTRNYPDVSDAEIPPLEWDKEGKTNEEGYLYAKLKSNVGVDGVEVTLNMDGALPGSHLSQIANHKVSFSAVPKSASIMVYKYDPKNQTVDKSVSQLFTEQKRPYNTFGYIAAELKAVDGKDLIDVGDKALYHGPNDWTASININPKTGLVTFIGTGFQTVTLDITKKNGTKRQYTYDFFPRRIFVGDAISYPLSSPLSSNENCEVNPNNHTPLYSDLISTGTGIALHEEFPNAYKFGILSDFKNVNTSYIKMLNPSKPQKYFAYDTEKGREFIGNTNISTYVVCVVNYQQ